jgi:quinol monooxygenase YgiN
MICLAVTYVAKPGQEERVVELLRTLVERSRAEPGCLTFVAHRSPADPRRFFLYEQYTDQAAVDAHRATPHFEQYVLNGLVPILETRTPEIYEPIGD